MKRYIVIVLVFLSFQSYSQTSSFYKSLNNNEAFMYSQINKDPVLISHGTILSENNLPNYSKGLQFMQAPGLFSSVDSLYNYLTDNNKFYFDNYDKKGSYYSKSSSHINERVMHYNNGVEIYNESLGYKTDEEAVQSAVWDLISDVRYQLIFEEDYIKDSNYEFLILHTVDVFKADIDVNSNNDIENVANVFLKILSEDEINKFNRRNVGLYCMIKEGGVWKACSSKSAFKYMQERGYLHLIKAKVESNNFYDVLSTVENGVRQYQKIN